MKLNCIIISVLMAFFSYSQTTVSVINEENIGIPFVKVAYQTSENTAKKYSQTDMDGKAVLSSDQKTDYLLVTLSVTGYHTINDTVLVNTHKRFRLAPSSIIMNEVCVTGEYVPTPTNQAINKTIIIRREDIINSGASTLSDILMYQSNIRIEQDNILGSGMSMNGMSGENVKILQNGVPVIGRLNGNIDLSQINLDEIERIEIVNGPLSVNYGTNALAGTINVITKKHSHPGFNGSILSMYESIGNYNLTGNISYTHKKQTLKISGGRKYFDGWRPNSSFFSLPKETIADTNRALSWNPKLQYMAELSYAIEIKDWKISPYYRYYQEKITNRGYPKKPYFETAFDDYYFTTRLDQGVTVDRKFKNSHLSFIGAYNYFKRIKNTYFKDLTTLDQTLTTNESDQDTSVFDLITTRATYSSKLNERFSFQLGTDINIETSKGRRITDQKQLIGDYAVFGSTIISIFREKLDIKPGARYAYNTVFRGPITPSLNIKYKITKDVQLRASAARGFRSPTLKELYFNFVDINHNIVGNIDLKPENSMNFNGGLAWLKPVKTTNLLKAEASAFYNDFENLITLGIKDDGGFTYINIGSFSTIGGQAELSYRTKKLRVQSNLTYIGRYNFAQNENLDPYIFSPELSTTASYKILKNKLAINLFYKYNGKLINYRVDDDDIQISIAGDYHILDLSLTSQLMNKNLTLVLGAKNLFNVQDINVAGASVGNGAHTSSNNRPIGRGTSLFLSLNYKFKHYKTSK